MKVNSAGIVFSLLALAASSNVLATDVSLDVWTENLERRFPRAICVKESVLRTCVPLTEGQCIDGIAVTTRTCIERFKSKLPLRVQLPDQGKEVGGDIGDCAEDLFVIENARILKHLPACQEYEQIVARSRVKVK